MDRGKGIDFGCSWLNSGYCNFVVNGISFLMPETRVQERMAHMISMCKMHAALRGFPSSGHCLGCI